MVVELKHPGGKSTRGPGNPIKLSRTNEESFSAAPLVGQHTNAVLSGLLGYEAQAIEELRRQGVVG
jgi:crotonobetainyl-CoA:carnitine CoA-transferase CaiB-like acyl-CoA transferase